MKKILTVLLCLLYPLLAFADSTLSFTPPSTDYSVIFLGNLFGVVDGVLHGTGSQIMGKMFGVFNAAVLALGGIVVTYTLIVGTMNTSHEGQFLGQKWSSIWIPVRSTIGLALLIPKASGYCLMQIFIMWVVVQGVGAADKIWNAALDYLNLGGVIMGAQSNVNPTTSSNSAVENIAKGTSAILQGQVCMKALQTVLTTARNDALVAKESGSGACLDGKMSANMAYFCSTPVPDFLSTVNAVEASNIGQDSVDMPNFTDGSIYQQLNHICGIIKWNKLDMASDTEDLDYVSSEDVETLNQSRAIAIQQMYMDLMPVAVAMVNNNPKLTPNSSADPDKQYNAVAQDQYGIPFLSSTQTPCTGPSDDCMNWGADDGGNTQTYIFTGLEFMNALTDYNAIMMPVLNLQSQGDNASLNNSYHEFIDGAEQQGWIMAGTYFFDLANLNGSVQANMNDVDTTSGLEQSTPYKNSDLTSPFDAPCSGTHAILCEFLSKNNAPITNIDKLIAGTTIQDGLAANVTSTSHDSVLGVGSSTTYGYITNASLIHLPGQPGLNTPQFKLNVNMQMGDSIMKIPQMDFGCGFKIFGFCVGGKMASALWNNLFKSFINIYLTYLTNLFEIIVQVLLIAPMFATMVILNEGVQRLNTKQAHPIIAMAYMGTGFVNYATDLYFQLLMMSALASFGGFMVLIVILPFIAAWIGIMFGIGFINAYYVPFLPYMLFTFGSLAWLMAVIEAMVAGPIVALGVTHPEGHDALGKAEQALMILVNVFLRPAMMIVGYIAAIALCYVGVFIVNSGFSHVMQFLMPPATGISMSNNPLSGVSTSGPTQSSTPYVNYAALYAGFFCLITYTAIYWAVVEKSFNLIYMLPDNILRWIGGQAESTGKDSAQWVDAVKKSVEDAGKEVGKAGKEASEGIAREMAKLGDSSGGKADIDGNKPDPSEDDTSDDEEPDESRDQLTENLDNARDNLQDAEDKRQTAADAYVEQSDFMEAKESSGGTLSAADHAQLETLRQEYYAADDNYQQAKSDYDHAIHEKATKS